MKKFLAFILTFTFLVSISCYAYASDSESRKNKNNDIIKSAIESDLYDLLLTIKDSSRDYELKEFELDSIELYNHVQIENILSSGEFDESVIHIPVSIDDNILLVFDIIGNENNYSTTLGVDFAPLLAELTVQNEERAYFIQENFSIFAVTPESIYEQCGRNVNIINESELSDAMVNAVKNIRDNNQFNKLNVISNEYTDTLSEVISESENSIAPKVLTVKKNLTNYPIVHQRIGTVQHGMCWAATVASIARFERPNTWGSLSAQNVCDYMGIGYDDGGTNAQARTALNHYLGSPYVPTIKGVLSKSAIKTVIDNNDPAYIQARRKKNVISYEYHAVALAGYNFSDNNNLKVRIMDPAYEVFKICAYNGSKWTFAFGSQTYTWYKTIRLLYS